MPSLFGWLDRFNFWKNLSYPQKGAILRALKAAASAIVGVLLAALTEGTLLPEGTGPITVIVVTAALQAVDKFIREWQTAQESPIPPGTPVDTDATVPDTDV